MKTEHRYEVFENGENALEKLRVYADVSHKTQYELAAELGCPPQTVNRWLNKKSRISKSYSFLICYMYRKHMQTHSHLHYKHLLNYNDFCKLANISRQALYKAIKYKRVYPKKVAGKKFMTTDDVRKFI